MSKQLGRADLLGRNKRRTQRVYLGDDDTPLEEQSYVVIRSLMEDELSEWQMALMNKSGQMLRDKTADIRIRLIVASVIDEESGDLVYTTEDIPALRKVDAKTLGRIAGASMELNGLSEQDLEDFVKNSARVRVADGPSS